jgi:hypothetical protein
MLFILRQTILGGILQKQTIFVGHGALNLSLPILVCGMNAY